MVGALVAPGFAQASDFNNYEEGALKPLGVLRVVPVETMVVEAESNLEKTDGRLVSIVATVGINFNATNITSS